MLVLTRKEGEAVLLRLADGSVIRLLIVQVAGHKVRLGFDAPADVKVWREDLGPPPEETESDEVAP